MERRKARRWSKANDGRDGLAGVWLAQSGEMMFRWWERGCQGKWVCTFIQGVSWVALMATRECMRIEIQRKNKEKGKEWESFTGRYIEKCWAKIKSVVPECVHKRWWPQGVVSSSGKAKQTPKQGEAEHGSILGATSWMRYFRYYCRKKYFTNSPANCFSHVFDHIQGNSSADNRLHLFNLAQSTPEIICSTGVTQERDSGANTGYF